MASFHVRSFSFPSASHPTTVNIQENLSKLKASQSSSIAHKTTSLKNLLECVNDVLQLSNSQNQYVEEALNGSVQLLDTCDAAKDFLSQTKGCLRELESSLRRRKGGDSRFTSEVEDYMISRKNLRKMISKFLRNLRKNKKKRASSNYSNFTNMLREVEEISVTVFESILTFISQPVPTSKPSGWSVIPNLMQSKSISCKGEVETKEMEKIEAELVVLKSTKDIKLVNVQNVVKELQAMESTIGEIEEELECVHRQLVKIRVSLLNVLIH